MAEQCRESALKYAYLPFQILDLGSSYENNYAFIFIQTRYYDTYLPFLLEACNDENPDVRQVSTHPTSVIFSSADDYAI